MAPTKFLFVNKNVQSTNLSRAGADQTADVSRHVQEQVHRTKKEQSKLRLEEGGALALSSSTLDIIKLTHASYTPKTSFDNNRMGQTEGLKRVDPWSVARVAAGGATSIATLNQSRKTGQRHNINKPSLRHLNTAQLRRSEQDSQDANSTPKLQYSICAKGKSIGPFNSTSVPITSTVHQMLVHFESMWYPRTLTQPNLSFSFTSSGQHVLQECIFDSLQINCVLAIMGSRLETCFGHIVEGGSKQYILQAIRVLRQRLGERPADLGKYIYATMKLYGSEAYRSNLNEALIHLKGARALWGQLDSWTDINPEYVPTLCGMTEVYFLPKVWETPATFPTMADPGPATICFSEDILQEYLDPQDETALALFTYLDLKGEEGILRQIVVDMIEYASVRRAMSSRVYLGQPVSVLVTQWAHLRRFSFVFRLMSIDAANQPLLHALRVSLVVWLALIADFHGFERCLEIVGLHLRDIASLIVKAEIVKHPEVTAWILLLGAVVGDGNTRQWFVEALANSEVFDMGSDLGVAQLFSFLETTSQRCLYCETIQRQSLGELAKELYLYNMYHCQLSEIVE
jgi:hypothetical protein